jgi:hypothetical protein
MRARHPRRQSWGFPIPVVALPSRSSVTRQTIGIEPPVRHRGRALDPGQVPRAGPRWTNITQRFGDKTPAAVKNRSTFLQQQERNRTFWQGKETTRVPEEAEEDESTVD